MTTLYALVYLVCLQSSGQCEQTIPEIYTDLTDCIMEVDYQRKSGVDANNVYCSPITEDESSLIAEVY